MVAATEVEPVAEGALAPVEAAGELELVPPEVAEAERGYWRGMVIGIIIGGIVCAGIWMGLAALALATAEPGWKVWPVLAMAAVVGLFAGVFFGGWAGITAASEKLEEAELHSHWARHG